MSGLRSRFEWLRSADLRLLLEQANRKAKIGNDLSLELFVDTSDYSQQRRFSRAVQSKDANLSAIEKREIDIL